MIRKNLKVDETTSIPLVLDMFDCECEDNYVHYFDANNAKTGNEIICKKCGATFDDCPNSRVSEVITFLEREYHKYVFELDVPNVRNYISWILVQSKRLVHYDCYGKFDENFEKKFTFNAV